MRRILLLTAIFLSGCIDVDVQMDADSPAVTPTETMSVYMDHFNNEDMKAINEMIEPPFFFLRGTDKGVYDKYEDFVDFQGLRNSGWSYSKVNSFEMIYEQTQLNHAQVQSIMKTHLKPSSYRLWRDRVKRVKQNHQRKHQGGS